MTSPPCICIFTGYYYPHFGGVEKYTASLSKFLTLNGCRVIIVTANTENAAENETVSQVEILRLPVLSLFKKRYPVPNFFSAGYWKLIRFIRNQDVDYYLVNTRFYITGFIGLHVASVKKKRAMLIEHGTGHLVTNNLVINFFAAQYEHFLTAAIKKYHPVFYGVSEACTRWLSHFNIQAGGVIYNGIDTGFAAGANPFFRRHFDIPDDNLLFSAASRLIPEKGVLELVTAFERFSATHKNAHLIIAGDGPLLDSFRLRFQNHRKIHIPGKITYEEVMNLFGESDVVIVPSRYPEGLPTVILEAGLAGCAVITTDVGGASEVINSRDFGLLIKNCDESKLISAMDELYNDENSRKNMAKNLHEKVTRQFDWELITRNLLNSSFFDKNHPGL